MPSGMDMILSLLPRGSGVGVSSIIKSGSLTHKNSAVPSLDHYRSVCCIPEQVVTAALSANSSKKGRFIVYYYFNAQSGDQDSSVIDMCHKYEFEIKLDGTLQFIKEKVVAESKIQKSAWDKYPSLIRKLTPIGEPSRGIDVVKSKSLLTEIGEEGWKEADKIWEEHAKKEVLVMEREIKEWKKSMEVKAAELELEKENLEGGAVHEEEEGKGDAKEGGEEEGKEKEGVRGGREQGSGKAERGRTKGKEKGKGKKGKAGKEERDRKKEGNRKEKEKGEKDPRRERGEQAYQAYQIREHRFALYGVGDHIATVSPISAVSGDGTWRLLVNDPWKANITTHVMFISLPELVCQMVACGVHPKEVPASLTQGEHGCIGMKFKPTVWSGPEWLRRSSPNEEAPPISPEKDGWWYSWKPQMRLWVC